jgi:hypothetical protein|tara:strand:- start:2073 stop:2276 length:204 start_codon:yes stop_codon:yes gene_type:complete
MSDDYDAAKKAATKKLKEADEANAKKIKGMTPAEQKAAVAKKASKAQPFPKVTAPPPREAKKEPKKK